MRTIEQLLDDIEIWSGELRSNIGIVKTSDASEEIRFAILRMANELEECLEMSDL